MAVDIVTHSPPRRGTLTRAQAVALLDECGRGLRSNHPTERDAFEGEVRDVMERPGELARRQRAAETIAHTAAVDAYEAAKRATDHKEFVRRINECRAWEAKSLDYARFAWALEGVAA